MSLRCLLATFALISFGVGNATEAKEPDRIPLIAAPAIGANLAAFPRLAGGDEASQRINQALTKADERLRIAAESCQAAVHDAGVDVTGTGWQRNVTIAMQGPRYLAFTAADNWYCGGPYPDTAVFGLAYDMRTGAPLNWTKLLPKSLVQTASVETSGDGTHLGVVASPALKTLYLQIMKPDAECATVLQDSTLQFLLWPDAGRGGVAIKPGFLAHAVAACGPDVVIPLDTLRSLGADPALLDAVSIGHNRGLLSHER